MTTRPRPGGSVRSCDGTAPFPRPPYWTSRAGPASIFGISVDGTVRPASIRIRRCCRSRDESSPLCGSFADACSRFAWRRGLTSSPASFRRSATSARTPSSSVLCATSRDTSAPEAWSSSNLGFSLRSTARVRSTSESTVPRSLRSHGCTPPCAGVTGRSWTCITWPERPPAFGTGSSVTICCWSPTERSVGVSGPPVFACDASRAGSRTTGGSTSESGRSRPPNDVPQPEDVTEGATNGRAPALLEYLQLGLRG
jgi:hypothetical protein